ncbi:MAG: methylmalonyl Co-A mutase-associated GTPase MeaB [Gemmatimonadota bacterium]
MSDPARADLTASQRELAEAFRAGRPLALSRCISLVENQRPGFETLLDALHAGVGRARRIGITGPPGAGKSTLTAGLARALRDRGETVGVIAVDPSSPFTGGALLGDRVRMDDLATEPAIFIRSMASRGSHGGLATSTREAADLMDAFGFNRILLETVGVGQSELEVASSADTTVVVLVPESGDGIQAMKAGLMEVADLFVVNKADRPGAESLRKEIEVVLHLRSGSTMRYVPAHHGIDLSALGRAREADAAPREDSGGSAVPAGGVKWEVPVLPCTASTGDGVHAVAAAIDAHFAWLEASGALEARREEQRLEHARLVLERAVQRRAMREWEEWRAGSSSPGPSRRATPYALSREVLGRLWPGSGGSGR